MINDITIEICIGNVSDAIKASSFPIDRIELNSALELGGLTPSLETLKYLKEKIDTKICCMVRPRGGNFLYDENEFKVMLKDAENLLKAKADGIVFGFLNEDNTINIDRTKTMSSLIHSYNAEAIFHKAFDDTPDPYKASETLIECKINRILTSGQAVYPDILKGCELINDLNNKYGDSIIFLPGGGVRIENVKDVLKVSGSKQIHMTSKKQNPGNYVEFDEEQLKQILKEISSL
ncbi:MAG: copper homeostasis protein CutC [Erysipelotrichaceae bacterium]|nr:copper homeostasis protein CutC [Erysipelotrichaceae bacterium]